MNDRRLRRALGISDPTKRLAMQRGYWAAEGVCLVRENGRPILWLKQGRWLKFANVPDTYEVVVQVWTQGHGYTFHAHRRDVTEKRPDR